MIKTRLFVFTGLAMCFVHGACADETKQIRLRHHEITVLLHSNENHLLVIKAMADPLLYSSRGHLIVWKVSSAPRLREILQLQGSAGPVHPEAVDVNSVSDINLMTTRNMLPFQFRVFGESFAWMPGGVMSSWLTIPGNAYSKIAVFEKLDAVAKFDESAFIHIDAYIKRTRRDIEEMKDRGIFLGEPAFKRQ